MSRIKYFKDNDIAVYIYGEKHEKHHGKHLLILKADEECQYGFDGNPLKCSKSLKNHNDRKVLRTWILSHRKELDIGFCSSSSEGEYFYINYFL